MSRHFSHTLADKPGLSRQQLVRTLLNATGEAIKAIQTGIEQGGHCYGSAVYTGRAGLAMAHYKAALVLSCSPELQSEASASGYTWADPSALQQLAAAQATDAYNYEVRRSSRADTFLCGAPGVLAVLAAAIARLQSAQSQTVQQAMQALAQISASSHLRAGQCELLYGQAGLLFACLYLQQELGAACVDLSTVRQDLVTQIYAAGRRRAQSGNPLYQRFGLMWSWHDKEYLGGAHGLAGILHVLALCPREVSAAAPDAPEVLTHAVSALIDICYESGNLPSSLGSETDKLVHWCHGAPGFVPLLCQIASPEGVAHGNAAAQSRSRDAAIKAGHTIWQRGLLKKGLGLCHGISGNAYSLLSLYRATGDELWLGRAQQFALFMAEEWKSLLPIPDEPFSLYEGLAGAVCLWMDCLDPLHSSFPGYELSKH